MLRPLTEALGQWSPREHAGWQKDPLALLAAGWSEIVGDDVARNSHPTRMLDGTLLVTTRSGAWSQQLTFLGDRILAAVHARLPQTSVTRLRFRVGKVPDAPRMQYPAVSRAPVGRRSSATLPASATSAEAVTRFRRAVDERRRAKRSAGWKECQGCGAFVAPRTGALCVTCANTRAEQRSATAARLLFEAPWLGYAGTAALVEDLTPQDYESIRTRLLSRWWETLMRARASKRLSRDGRERTIASSYVVLKSRLAPEAIDPATLRNLLGDELYDVIYGTELMTRTNDK
ncbi:MAG: DUF721 domain-containing protein [Candidatus Eremiobacteraeota bacterium]|nr:DUF721 domain-containing protein [Candidatus Eremiobacteraeota bacterium]